MFCRIKNRAGAVGAGTRAVFYRGNGGYRPVLGQTGCELTANSVDGEQ